MRRELEKKERPKIKPAHSFLYQVKKQEQPKVQKHISEYIVKANRLGRVQGLERMYELMLEACKNVKGIGPKRKEALRLEIVNLIMREVDMDANGD